MENILETFRQEENRRNLIARTYEEAEKEFKRVNRLQINVQLLSDGKELDDKKYESLVTEKVKELCEKIQEQTTKELKDAERDLKKILGLYKPATINKDFEDAVKEMQKSTQSATQDVNLPSTTSKTETEDKNIVEDEKPLKIENTEPWKEEEYLREMFLTKGMTAKQIADINGCKKSDVGNYLHKYGIRRDNFVPGKQVYSKKERP